MVIFRPLSLGFKGGNNGCRLIEEGGVFKLGGGGSHGGLGVAARLREAGGGAGSSA
jgi:hypothetical protein